MTKQPNNIKNSSSNIFCYPKGHTLDLMLTLMHILSSMLFGEPQPLHETIKTELKFSDLLDMA